MTPITNLNRLHDGKQCNFIIYQSHNMIDIHEYTQKHLQNTPVGLIMTNTK